MYKFFKNSLAILYWEMAITSSQIAELVIFSHVSSGVNAVHINIIRLPIKMLLLLFSFSVHTRGNVRRPTASSFGIRILPLFLFACVNINFRDLLLGHCISDVE